MVCVHMSWVRAVCGRLKVMTGIRKTPFTTTFLGLKQQMHRNQRLKKPPRES